MLMLLHSVEKEGQVQLTDVSSSPLEPGKPWFGDFLQNNPVSHHSKILLILLSGGQHLPIVSSQGFPGVEFPQGSSR